MSDGNRRNNYGVQASARQDKRPKNMSTSMNSNSKINANLRSTQNVKSIAKEGFVSATGLHKNSVGGMSQAQLQVQPSLKVQASHVQRNGGN